MAAPANNKNAANAKVAKAALERALELRSPIDRYQTLVEIWDKQIVNALNGDIAAATMIVDRLDGKPSQGIDADINIVGNLASLIEAARKRIENAVS